MAKGNKILIKDAKLKAAAEFLDICRTAPVDILHKVEYVDHMRETMGDCAELQPIIEQVETEIKALQERYKLCRSIIETRITDTNFRKFLESRHIHGMLMERIMQEMNISREWAKRLYRQALAAASAVIEQLADNGEGRTPNVCP